MSMKSLRGAGFTIVETLIVLAVTSAMFLIAMLAFRGQHDRTQFNQSIRDTQSKIQDVANDVTAGYFPQVDGWSCQRGDGVNKPEVVTSSGSTQGTNQQCIFVGKAIHFGVADDECSDNCTELHIVTMIGNRKVTTATGTKDVENLEEANLAAASADSPYNESYTLLYGMGVSRVVDGDGKNLSGVAVLSSLGNYNSSGDAVAGSQTSTMYGIPGTLGTSAAAFEDAANTISENAADYKIDEAIVCLRDAVTNGRVAAVVLTPQAAGVGTQLLVESQVPGVCNG